MEHKQIKMKLSEVVFIDVDIAPEIDLINRQGLVTEASCQGPPPTALIKPSMVNLAKQLNYKPTLQRDIGFYEIKLKTKVPFNKAKAWDKLIKWLDKDPELTTGGYPDLQHVREKVKRVVDQIRRVGEKK
jgi:hypothetical protein